MTDTAAFDRPKPQPQDYDVPLFDGNEFRDRFSEVVERPNYHPQTGRILAALHEERQRQIAKWGDQSDLPDFGIGRNAPMSRHEWYGMPAEAAAKASCEEAFRFGTGSFADIFAEEVAEVFGARDIDSLRTELIQAAAVCVAWVEAIDQRTARGESWR